MNPAQLLAHFDRIAEAPDAVPRLRQFILDLAVRGKLVEQGPADEPAAKLLEHVEKEKRDLVREGKLSKTDLPLPLGEDEIPFEIPATWQWVRVSEVAEARLGKMLDKAKNKGTPRRYLRNVNVRWFDFDLSDLLTMKLEDSELDELSLHRGDVLICEGGEPGRSAVWDERETGIYFQKAIHRVRFFGSIVPIYFVRGLYQAAASGRLAQFFTGVTIKHLTGKGLARYTFPLPPLAEQHRIVAKVDELMALCNELEAAQAKREKRRDRLVAATLHALNNGDATAEPGTRPTFEESACFTLHHLSRLATRPEHVHQLRQTILNLAVRGKLVARDPNDEPIHTTLRRITDGRAKLVRTRKARHKKLDDCADLAKRDDLPESWAVERLGNLVDPENTISYGVLVPGNDVEDGIPFVRAQDLSLSAHPDRPNKTISYDIEKPYARTRLRGGEILLCVVGSIGKLGIVPPSWAGANIARAVARIMPVPDISRDYLLLVLRSQPVQTYFSEATRTLAQPTLNVGLIEHTPIPLPPLGEQHRIVAKVEELMALCDALEAQLITTATASRQLLEATLHEALAH